MPGYISIILVCYIGRVTLKSNYFFTRGEYIMGRSGYSFIIKSKADLDTIKSQALDTICSDREFDRSTFRLRVDSSTVFANEKEAERFTSSKIDNNEGYAAYFYAPSKQGTDDFYELKSTKSLGAKIQKYIDQINEIAAGLQVVEDGKIKLLTCPDCSSKINLKYASSTISSFYGQPYFGLNNFKQSQYEDFKNRHGHGFRLLCPACKKGVLVHKKPAVLAKLMEAVEALHLAYYAKYVEDKKEIHTFVNLISDHY
jgi:DNA-directed RNA polymerase subunit RPC12/RpoP